MDLVQAIDTTQHCRKQNTLFTRQEFFAIIPLPNSSWEINMNGRTSKFIQQNLLRSLTHYNPTANFFCIVENWNVLFFYFILHAGHILKQIFILAIYFERFAFFGMPSTFWNYFITLTKLTLSKAIIHRQWWHGDIYFGKRIRGFFQAINLDLKSKKHAEFSKLPN